MSTRRFLRRLTKRELIKLIVVLSLVVGFALFLLWFGFHLYTYDVEYYEPRDLEREKLHRQP